jgi:hypothetical protein
MLAPKRKYHESGRYIPVLFDCTDAKQARLLNLFRVAFRHHTETEVLNDRLTLLRLHPGVPEVRS